MKLLFLKLSKFNYFENCTTHKLFFNFHENASGNGTLYRETFLCLFLLYFIFGVKLSITDECNLELLKIKTKVWK